MQNPIHSASSNELKIKTDLERIKMLEQTLFGLTILENPLEIKNICESIIDIKKALEKESTGTDGRVDKQ